MIFKLYLKLSTGWCRSNVCLVGKTAVVTGANAGIGYHTAEDLAKRGARVILACRNMTKCQQAAEEMIKATDNANIICKKLDLASLKSVRDFASDIRANEKRLDILVNNAGIMYSDNERSEDGLVLIMQNNYFGPFLLTYLLLDLLKDTPNARIVNVSSKAAKRVKLDLSEINSLKTSAKSYFKSINSYSNYSKTKLCNIFFTIELAKKLKGTTVTTYSLHPGVVFTKIFDGIPKIVRPIVKKLLAWYCKNPLEGAQTTIYCCVQKGIEPLSGEHFADCQLVTRYKTARSPEIAEKLWNATLELLKLKN